MSDCARALTPSRPRESDTDVDHDVAKTACLHQDTWAWVDPSLCRCVSSPTKSRMQTDEEQCYGEHGEHGEDPGRLVSPHLRFVIWLLAYPLAPSRTANAREHSQASEPLRYRRLYRSVLILKLPLSSPASIQNTTEPQLFHGVLSDTMTVVYLQNLAAAECMETVG